MAIRAADSSRPSFERRLGQVDIRQQDADALPLDAVFDVTPAIVAHAAPTSYVQDIVQRELATAASAVSGRTIEIVAPTGGAPGGAGLADPVERAGALLAVVVASAAAPAAATAA